MQDWVYYFLPPESILVAGKTFTLVRHQEETHFLGNPVS